ncbi:hypothetical protein U9M48_012508 [Paspalum notatum var. saurae]|uniref:Lipase-like C-terminal domain-containing protein n=1 Tax=Paspalum notatum var. saurae TaxID=547442 RepID=A0AAQ3SY24_PASNO
MMRSRARAALLGVAELLVSAVLHLGYAFYIFGAAVAADVSVSLVERLMDGGGVAKGAAVDGEDEAAAVLDGSVPPIVLVHGIFGFGKGVRTYLLLACALLSSLAGTDTAEAMDMDDLSLLQKLGGLSYFAGAENKDDRVLVPDLGSLTSVHDRARELFYYLKGGRVDYGEEHSRACGHSRYGRVYARGHYPAWDADHPAHFVGHSAGAQVVRLLQQMLHDRAFESHGAATSADWVLSVTSLSGALNGTTRAYLDGVRADDGSGRSLRPLCLLQVCRVGSLLYHWLDLPFLTRYYDFGFAHFGVSRRLVGVRGLVDMLLGRPGAGGPFATGDWVLPDLTIQGAARINARVATFPRAFYFSYASRRTAAARAALLRRIHPLLFVRALQMRRWRYPAGDGVEPPYPGYKDEDWADNDGALNTFSMTHPRVPVEHPSVRVDDDEDCHPLRPGIWYYKIVEADHMTFVINRRRGGVQFDLIYDSIFQNCRKHVFRTAPPPTLPNQS